MLGLGSGGEVRDVERAVSVGAALVHALEEDDLVGRPLGAAQISCNCVEYFGIDPNPPSDGDMRPEGFGIEGDPGFREGDPQVGSEGMGRLRFLDAPPEGRLDRPSEAAPRVERDLDGLVARGDFVDQLRKSCEFISATDEGIWEWQAGRPVVPAR